MPRYLVIHHAPGVSQEDFQRNIPEVLKGKHAAFAHTYVNLTNGTVVNIYEGDSEEAVGRELERVGFPYDEIQQIQFEGSAADSKDGGRRGLVARENPMVTTEVRPRRGAWFGKEVPAGKTTRKVNVFEGMLAHQGMLEQLPLFPYFGPGDIVPTAALSLSLPDMPRVHFYHYNDLPEVILAMAGDGAMLTTGQLYLQQGTHGVTTFLRSPKGKEAQGYQISLIIIRMKPQGPQNEGFVLRCGKCNEVVFRMDRDVFQGPSHRYYPELPNLRFYADAVDAFNAEERTCPGCGLVQARFPQELMGWRRYAQYAELANRARANIEAACSG